MPPLRLCAVHPARFSAAATAADLAPTWQTQMIVLSAGRFRACCEIRDIGIWVASGACPAAHSWSSRTSSRIASDRISSRACVADTSLGVSLCTLPRLADRRAPAAGDGKTGWRGPAPRSPADAAVCASAAPAAPASPVERRTRSVRYGVAGAVLAGLLRCLAPDVDAPHERESEHLHAGGARRARPARPVVEPAHNGDAGDIDLDVLGHDDGDATHPGVGLDRHLAFAEPRLPQVEHDPAHEGERHAG